MQAAQRGAQHLAALVEGGAGDFFQQLRIGRKAGLGQGGQVHHRRFHLGRGHEGLRRQGQDDPGLAAPLGKDREPAIVLAAGLRHDALRDLLLEHQRQRLPEGRPFGRRQPADQQFRPDVVGQVRRDADRGRDMGQRVDFQRIAVDHRQAAGIGFGDLLQRGNGAGVLLDRQHVPGAFGQQPAREAAGTGAHLDHVALRQVARRTGDAGGEVQVQQEVLSKLLLRAQVVAGDDVAQGGQAVDRAHAAASGGFAPPHPRRVFGSERSLMPLPASVPCPMPCAARRWCLRDRPGPGPRCRRRCRGRARCARRAGPA